MKVVACAFEMRVLGTVKTAEVPGKVICVPPGVHGVPPGVVGRERVPCPVGLVLAAAVPDIVG